MHSVIRVNQTSRSNLWVVLTRFCDMHIESNNSGCVTETTPVSEQVREHEECEFWRCTCLCVSVYMRVVVFLTLLVTAGAEPDIQAAQ